MARLLVSGLLLATAAPLIAQTAPVAQPAPIIAPHAMSAKTTTRAEVQARVQTHFARRDANRDGFLTSEELTARGGRHDMKVHHRGGKSGEQAKRDPNVAFDRIDGNRDGSISRDEFARAREVRIEKRIVLNQPGQPGAMDMKHHRGMRGMHGGGGMMGGAMLKMADANGDGKVSLAEATAGALQHFDRMDSNRDGRLTPEERAAGRAQMKQMRRAG